MEFREVQQRIAAGRTNYLVMCAIVVTFTISNTLFCGIQWLTWGILIEQFLATSLTIAIMILVTKGWAFRWYLFALLIVDALGAFFQGGMRMSNLAEDGGLGAYLSIGTGLTLIGCAVYLGGNSEISLFLAEKQQSRRLN